MPPIKGKPHGLQSWIATQGQNQAMKAHVQADHRRQILVATSQLKKTQVLSQAATDRSPSPRVIICRKANVSMSCRTFTMAGRVLSSQTRPTRASAVGSIFHQPFADQVAGSHHESDRD